MTRFLALLFLATLLGPSRPAPEPALSTMGVDRIEKADAESSVTQERTAGTPAPQPAADVPPSSAGPLRPVQARTGVVLRGRASWVHSGLGDAYLAARMPKGTTLRICGALGCVTRRVMDYGPSKRLHPGRIVDLSRFDFARICGDPELLGTCPVRAVVMGAIVPPSTDALP